MCLWSLSPMRRWAPWGFTHLAHCSIQSPADSVWQVLSKDFGAWTHKWETSLYPIIHLFTHLTSTLCAWHLLWARLLSAWITPFFGLEELGSWRYILCVMQPDKAWISGLMEMGLHGGARCGNDRFLRQRNGVLSSRISPAWFREPHLPWGPSLCWQPRLLVSANIAAGCFYRSDL
jgi:hypothetical protein